MYTAGWASSHQELLPFFFFGFSFFFGKLIEFLEQILRIAPATAFGTFHICILSSQHLQTKYLGDIFKSISSYSYVRNKLYLLLFPLMSSVILIRSLQPACYF